MSNMGDCSAQTEVTLDDETLLVCWDLVAKTMPLARTAALGNGAEPRIPAERVFVHMRKQMLARGFLETY
jgi:hypothetical protein